MHPFTAEVILRHHQYQKNPYPAILPPLPEQFDNPITRSKIKLYSLLLSICDFDEAYHARKNHKYDSQPSNTADYLQFMIQQKPMAASAIQKLAKIGMISL